MRPAVLGLLLPALLVTGPHPPPLAETSGVQPVTVTNFPEIQEVKGSVTIGQPAPATRLVSTHAIVTPAAPTDITSLTDGGTIDASGYVSAVFSLSVTLQGTIGAPARVGALLVPDVADVLTAMRNQYVVQFPISVEAPVTTSVSGIHASTPAPHRLAFPRYRVYFYDTAPRTAEVTLYAYLSNS